MKGLFLFPPVTPQCAAVIGIDPCSPALFKTTLDISVEAGVSEEDRFSLGPFSKGAEKAGLIILALSMARMMVPACTIAECSCVPLHGAKIYPQPTERDVRPDLNPLQNWHLMDALLWQAQEGAGDCTALVIEEAVWGGRGSCTPDLLLHTKNSPSWVRLERNVKSIQIST